MSLSAPKTFVNVLLPSLVTSCPHFLIGDNSCDFWFDSGKTFAESIDSLAQQSSRNDPFQIVRSLPSFKVDLPRTACVSVCLSVEKMTAFADTFDILFDIVKTDCACIFRVEKRGRRHDLVPSFHSLR